ncbi:MAG: carboxylating nicotinate-nucleotide diphosphorylase [Acidiferrobacterales bacterium]
MRNEIIETKVREALAEDIGSGDLTAALVADEVLTALVIVREPAVICGSDWFNETFRQLDSRIAIEWFVEDGQTVVADDKVCRIKGNARVLLSGERTALNFLQMLSGTATLVKRYTDAVAGTKTTVLDTRKTIPGLRDAQKYAVSCGGGHNHRHGLYDAVLIKENHIQAAGGIAAVMDAARKNAPAGSLIEIEVENLGQLQEALDAGAKRILLDNFQLETLRKAVQRVKGEAQLEASGGINLKNIRALAETGVDFVSIGALTKDVRAIDFSLRFE